MEQQTGSKLGKDRAEALVCDFDPEAQRTLHTLRMHDRRPEAYGRLVEAVQPPRQAGGE